MFADKCVERSSGLLWPANGRLMSRQPEAACEPQGSVAIEAARLTRYNAENIPHNRAGVLFGASA